LPTLERYVPTPSGGGASGGDTFAPPLGAVSCKGGLYALNPVADDALPFEAAANSGISPVVYTADDPNVQRNLNYLRLQVRNAETALVDKAATMTVNSAYRPLAYQSHLWQVWTLANIFSRDPALAAECAALKTQVDAEMTKHGIGSVVARPDCRATHVRGMAVDLSFQGITYEEADALFQSKGIDLKWQAIPGDQFHFNVQNPPYTGLAC
jgi:hypothetical protein